MFFLQLIDYRYRSNRCFFSFTSSAHPWSIAIGGQGCVSISGTSAKNRQDTASPEYNDDISSLVSQYLMSSFSFQESHCTIVSVPMCALLTSNSRAKNWQRPLGRDLRPWRSGRVCTSGRGRPHRRGRTSRAPSRGPPSSSGTSHR
jgi:hypothetical protein